MAVEPPRKGTRGTFIPQVAMRLVTRLTLGQFRRGRARTQGGVHTVLLETRGAKSGELRRALLGFLDDEGGSWLVIASLLGAARNPQWLHNLAAHPEATLQLEDGRRVAVRAESLDGQDLEAAWARLAVEAPEYVKYRSKTDREVPVVRLREIV